ncbi:cobyrinic acid a,c-diamide synthase [Laceyella sacchari]|jgi:cobyrinic acid a,c-diamide synthase|uniref:cobyrinate a,c-diamide synthase n=1 Tax=Laceyella sacchari TaxID=37482 RepID=UPI00104C3107|nr:cobyrinate a,c-diamide synthase [Laceyella sacchari]TCW41430.1 cobyrinic acid a,c-diamide synthase [Laceyella sacchari]
MMKRPRLLIAGTGSGVGKTTITLGVMAAFRRRGLKVQGFKCGPDYIDPTYHTAVTGRVSRNVDTWMLTEENMRECFIRGSDGADLSVVEGVMGLYDGKDPLSDQGSSASIAMALDCPVILVVNVHSMARSAAAVVLGYQRLNPQVAIRGVIANRAGSEGHYRLVKAAIEQECGIPVLGWLARDESMTLPERHLGLVPAVERGECEELFAQLADKVEQGVDMERLLAIAQDTPPLSMPSSSYLDAVPVVPGAPVVAVAKDSAFHFYYPENLELLERLGAKLVYFSPLADEAVPEEADGLLIGGGFPEEFAERLSRNERAKQSIRRFIQHGKPVFAECGGYMYLARSIETTSGQVYPMVGFIPGRVRMQHRLSALGYREVRATDDNLLFAKGESVRGHEFHYSSLEPEAGSTWPFAYTSEGRRGEMKEGYAQANVLAGYTHLHFVSNPRIAARFLQQCTKARQQRSGEYA